jgi:hypothetical protein
MGIRDFNFRNSRFRKREKSGVNQSLIYIHPFSSLTPLHPQYPKNLFLGSTNIERGEEAFAPSTKTYAYRYRVDP